MVYITLLAPDLLGPMILEHRQTQRLFFTLCYLPHNKVIWYLGITEDKIYPNHAYFYKCAFYAQIMLKFREEMKNHFFSNAYPIS